MWPVLEMRECELISVPAMCGSGWVRFVWDGVGGGGLGSGRSSSGEEIEVGVAAFEVRARKRSGVCWCGVCLASLSLLC